MYTNGLMQLRVAEAFELCQRNNTQQVKQGEEMLKQMRQDPKYILLLLNYLDERNATEDNKMLAATEINKVLNELILSFDEETYCTIVNQLFFIYIGTTDRLAKYLRKILEYCPLEPDLIARMFQLKEQSLKSQIRLLKLFRMYLDKAEDEFCWDYSDVVVGKLLMDIGKEIKGECPPMCLKLLYESVKILVLTAMNHYETYMNEDNLNCWISIMKYVLKLSAPAQETQLLQKMKILALQCLTILIQFKTDDASFLIENLQFMFSLVDQSKKLKYMVLEEMRFFCKCQWGPSVDPKLIQSINIRIMQFAIRQVYNPSEMMKIFKKDFNNFIEIYFESLSEGVLASCRKVLKEMANRHTQTWKKFVEMGMMSDPTANMFLNFVCQSAIVCSDYGVKKHKFQNQQLKTISAKLQQSTLKFLWDALQGTTGPLSLNDDALCTVISVLRFYSHYRLEPPKKDILTIMKICSRLALKNSELRRVCYYFLKKTAFLINIPKTNLTRAQTDPTVEDIIKILLKQIGKLDVLQLELGDLEFISMMLFSYDPETILKSGVQQDLKKICMIGLQLASAGGDHQDIRHVVSIPCYYTSCYGYDKDFNQFMPSLMDKGTCNPEMALLFVNYFTMYKDDPKGVKQMYRDIISQEFLCSNLESLRFYLPILQALIYNVKPEKSEIIRIQMILVSVLKKAIVTDQSRCIRQIFDVLIGLPNVILNIKDLYTWLLNRMDTNKQRNPSGFECLVLLMAYKPPENQLQVNQAVDCLAKMIRKQRFSKHYAQFLRIVFDFYDVYFKKSNTYTNKLWASIFENLLKRRQGKSTEELQTFSKKFHEFQQKHKPQICEILRQKYQIELTSLLLQYAVI